MTFHQCSEHSCISAPLNQLVEFLLFLIPKYIQNYILLISEIFRSKKKRGPKGLWISLRSKGEVRGVFLSSLLRCLLIFEYDVQSCRYTITKSICHYFVTSVFFYFCFWMTFMIIRMKKVFFTKDAFCGQPSLDLAICRYKVH